ncbi:MULTISPECIES: ABC transporter permease [unclassified Staphylococcus]|uniref:ABC transporter permease n=2 Tax=Staphylococcus TaxID=1279 RepID=UPI001868ABE6|nr:MULTISPECIES: ABC transporter permease [unclassified Staphylococcus]
MINKILLSIKMQFRVPISVFFSLIFPIIMMLVIIMSYGNFNIGNGRHFIDKYFLISTSIGLLPIAFISFPIWLSESIENDTLKRLKYFDVNISSLIISNIISYCFLAIFSVVLNIIIGKVFFSLILPSTQYFITFFLQIFYNIIALLMVGTFLALLIKKSKILLPFGMILLFLTYMIIGVFVQYGELPNVLKEIGNWIPIKYATNDFYSIWTNEYMWDLSFLKINSLYILVTGALSLFIYKFKK